MIACSLGAGNPVWLADPAMLPEIPIEAEPPADWTEHTVGLFRARLPHEGAEPVVHDLGVTVRGDDGRTKTSLAQFVLPVGDPYPMPRATAMARATVPGADLVTMGVNEEEDGTALVSVRVHQKGLAHHIQLFRRTLEEAPLLAHQIVAGLRLT